MARKRGGTPQSHIGVLFVHGIGEQKRAETLTHFGEPLLEWLSEWIGRSGTVRVIDATIARGESEEPARVRLSIEISGQPGPFTVTLAEAWWASAFLSSGFSQVWFWGIHFYIRAWWRIARQTLQVAIRIRTPFDQARHQRKHLRQARDGLGDPHYRRDRILLEIRALAESVPITISVVSVFLVLGPLLAVSLILGLISIALLLPLSLVPPLRPTILRIRLALANSAGDAHALLRSPFAFHEMTSSVTAQLRWLESACDRTLVVAHSQGAVIAYEVLVSERRPKLGGFVTLGAALNLLKRRRFYAAPPDVSSVATLSAEDAGPYLLLERFARLYPGVSWENYWTPWDPVSAGPLLREHVPPLNEHRISNRASLLRDHSTYAGNAEQFVGPLGVLIGRLAGIDLASLTPQAQVLLDAAEDDRTWRVARLSDARAIFVLAAAFAGWVFSQEAAPTASRFASPIARIFSKPAADFLARTAGNAIIARVIGGVVIAALVSGLYLLAAFFWQRWDSDDRRRLLRRQEPDTWPVSRVLFHGATLMSFFLLTIALIYDEHFSWEAPLLGLVAGVMIVRGPPRPGPGHTGGGEVRPLADTIAAMASERIDTALQRLPEEVKSNLKRMGVNPREDLKKLGIDLKDTSDTESAPSKKGEYDS